MSAKSILFRVELEGKGVVNFDSNDQRFMYNKLKRGIKEHENVNFAKRNFYVDADGNYDSRIKISSNCLRNLIFKDSQMFHSTSIMHHPDLMMYAIASPCALLRGYLYAKKTGTIKRKSAITITDAEQTQDTLTSVPHIEVGVRSGEKNTDKNDTKSDTSLFFKETVGDIKYQAVGAVDLMELQFISTSVVFDRLAFNPDEYQQYKDALVQHIPDLDCELGYYQIKGSDINVPEYGVKLSQKNVNFLVRDFFKRLINVNHSRSGSYVNVSNVEYKIVENVLVDKMNDDNGWIKLTDITDFPEIEFQERYEMMNFDAAKNLCSDIESKVADNLKYEKELKEKKKAEKEKNKEAKKSKNNNEE